MGPNRAIELHDSDLLAVADDGGAIVVRLHAMVHASDGQPGVEAGTIWQQEVELRFIGATVLRSPTRFPMRIWDGALTHHGAPVDLDPAAQVTGPFELTLQGEGGPMVVRAEAMESAPLGAPAFLEDFPGR